jgi:hypothetical protein
MTPLLALLPLLAPAQSAPQAVDYLPADTLIAFEVSIEPWQRLGDQTILAQMMQQESMAQLVTPMAAQFDMAMAQATAQLGFDLASLLAGSRMYLAVPFSVVENEGGQIVFAVDLDADIAQGVELGKMISSFGQGAWSQNGTVLVGTMHTDEMESMDQRIQTGFEEGVFMPSPMRDGDTTYLNGLLDAGRKGAGFSASTTFRNMAAKARTGNELMAVWVVLEQIDRAFIENASGEALPEGIEALAEQAGISNLNGVGYSFSIAGPMFEDRFVLSGPEFGAQLFAGDMLELVNLPQLLSALPHDTVQVQLGAMDYAVLGDMLKGMLELGMQISGEEVPAEAEPFLAALWQVFESVGPVSAGIMRVDDFDRGQAGDAWIQVQNEAGLREALSVIPEEVFEGIQSAMAMNAGGLQLKMEIEGSRFVFLESLGQPTTERLLTQGEFQPSADWLRQFPASQVFGIEFVHRDLIVEGFQLMRDRGDELLGLMGGDIPISFEVLPEPVVMQSILRPMTGVWLADTNGLSWVTRSPLGAIPTRMLVALPTMMNVMEAMGMGILDQLDEEEF